MKLEFQEDLMKFLVQEKEAKKYIEILEQDVFDLDNYKFVFTLLKGFYQKYKSQPSKGNLLEYFDRELKEAKYKGEDLSNITSLVENTIKDIYIPLTANIQQIREVLIEEYQLKLMRNVLIENAAKMKTANADIVKDVFKQVSDIKKLGEYDINEEENHGTFALRDFGLSTRKQLNPSPTYLDGLNALTSVRGFYAPQLIIFMGGPKSFKTGFLINLALNYVRNGKKVYYVDCENGETRILDRFYQCMLEATWEEFNSGDLDELHKEMVNRFSVLVGDFLAEFYPAHTKSVQDVEIRLNELKTEENWQPDIICWDYPDLMKPNDWRIKEKRLQIQAVYFDIINLHKKLKVFGLGLTQVGRNASRKSNRDETDFAEDFGKAANAHASFSLERDEDEREAGVMRVVPVVQRDGIPSHFKRACFVRVDEGRMLVEEITKTDWENKVREVRTANGKETKKGKKPNKKELTDE